MLSRKVYRQKNWLSFVGLGKHSKLTLHPQKNKNLATPLIPLIQSQPTYLPTKTTPLKIYLNLMAFRKIMENRQNTHAHTFPCDRWIFWVMPLRTFLYSVFGQQLKNCTNSGLVAVWRWSGPVVGCRFSCSVGRLGAVLNDMCIKQIITPLIIRIIVWWALVGSQ